MVERELVQLIAQVQQRKCEEQTLEIKAAHAGCPEKLYDTLSAFSNQDDGGTILFGIDERQGYKKVGVYDAQDLQKRVMEYGEQMTPVVRPMFTVCDEDGLVFVSAEIPPLDVAERPCFQTARGRLQGSFTRVGDADKRMSEYEVYSYEAFRKKYRDDIRPVDQASIVALDPTQLENYIFQRKNQRPNLASLPDQALYELTGIQHNGQITLAAVLLFSPYPQAYFPQLSIIATSVPGTEKGILDEQGRRFTDTKRIEGTLPEMLESAVTYVRTNMRVATAIGRKTGERTDLPQYPMDAVRELILNALVHRDYSIHTEGMPIQVTMYTDRLEISNPGGLYGRIRVDQLGKVQPDTRNPVLVTAMEMLGKTENRYSGIPRVYHAMAEMGLPKPVFSVNRNTFSVCLYNAESMLSKNREKAAEEPQGEKDLLTFCKTPRSRAEIAEYLGIASKQYALHRYLDPLVKEGAIRLSIPEKPRSRQQRYQTDAAYLTE